MIKFEKIEKILKEVLADAGIKHVKIENLEKEWDGVFNPKVAISFDENNRERHEEITELKIRLALMDSKYGVLMGNKYDTDYLNMGQCCQMNFYTRIFIGGLKNE